MAFSKIVNDALRRAATETKTPLAFLRAIAHIESSGRPTAVTGQYKGLFQLNNDGFRKHGGRGSIFDPYQNAMAGARRLKHDREQLAKRLERKPTDAEVYMAHQQGLGGSSAHIKHRDRAAWASMHSTTEGKQKGAAWAKRAIWQNLPASAKKEFGKVENVTSGNFVDWWADRYARALEQTKEA